MILKVIIEIPRAAFMTSADLLAFLEILSRLIGYWGCMDMDMGVQTDICKCIVYSTRAQTFSRRACWTAIKQTTNQLSQVRTWLSWFVVCLIAVQQNDDPGPWVFINSIARPIIGLAQLNYTVVLQPRHSAIG